MYEHSIYKQFVKAVAVPLTGARKAPGSVLRTFGDFTSIYLRAHLPILQTRELWLPEDRTS